MRSPSHTRDEAIAALDRAAAVLGIATDRRRLSFSGWQQHRRRRS